MMSTILSAQTLQRFVHIQIAEMIIIHTNYSKMKVYILPLYFINVKTDYPTIKVLLEYYPSQFLQGKINKT